MFGKGELTALHKGESRKGASLRCYNENFRMISVATHSPGSIGAFPPLSVQPLEAVRGWRALVLASRLPPSLVRPPVED
jgi:hypothetical protein